MINVVFGEFVWVEVGGGGWWWVVVGGGGSGGV